MQKKNLLTLVGSICLILVLAALLLPACAKEEAPPPPAPPAPAPPKPVEPIPAVKTDVTMPKFITFLGGGSATSTYTLTAKAMEAASKDFFPDVSTRVELSAGPKSQVRIDEWIDAETSCPWAITDFHSYLDHSKGEGRFKEAGPFSNLKLLWEMHPITAEVACVLRDSPITDQSELLTKRISAGAGAGVSWEIANIALREGYGFDYDDMKTAGGMVYTDSWSEEAEMLAAGDIDCFTMNLIQPFAAIVKVNVSKGIRLLPYNDAAIEGILKNWYGSTRVTVPAGTYEGQTEDYKTTGLILAFFTHKDVPDDVAYNLMAMFLDGNAKRAKKLHPSAYERPFVEYGLECFESGKYREMYHPGAANFWQDVAARK